MNKIFALFLLLILTVAAFLFLRSEKHQSTLTQRTSEAISPAPDFSDAPAELKETDMALSLRVQNEHAPSTSTTSISDSLSDDSLQAVSTCFSEVANLAATTRALTDVSQELAQRLGSKTAPSVYERVNYQIRRASGATQILSVSPPASGSRKGWRKNLYSLDAEKLPVPMPLSADESQMTLKAYLEKVLANGTLEKMEVVKHQTFEKGTMTSTVVNNKVFQLQVFGPDKQFLDCDRSESNALKCNCVPPR